MKNAKEVSGFYGSNHTPCTVFYYNGWYVCEGSVNINHTEDEFEDGVDVETLSDDDIITAGPINSLDELITAVDE